MSRNERIAFQSDIKFITMPGNIGMVSNSSGLGLSMSDMIINLGGSPANFCDLGGSTIHEQIDTILNLLNDDEKVRVIFINCFGGIVSIEKLVATLGMNFKFGNIHKPIVLRGHGNGSESIKDLKEEWAGKYDLIVEPDLENAC